MFRKLFTRNVARIVKPRFFSNVGLNHPIVNVSASGEIGKELMSVKNSNGDVVNSVFSHDYPAWIETPVHFVEDILIKSHELSGLPWWSVIVLSAISTKIIMFSFSLQTVRNLENIKFIGPQILSIRKHVVNLKGYQKLFVTAKLLNVAAKKAGVRFIWSFLFILLPLATWIVFVLALRGLTLTNDTFKNEGPSMFPNYLSSDLSQPSTFLAISSIILLIVNFELAIQLFPPGSRINKFVSGLQLVYLFAAPFIIDSPQGIFFYIIPSSLFALAQNRLMLHAGFRKFLKLSELPKKL